MSRTEQNAEIQWDGKEAWKKDARKILITNCECANVS